MKIRIYFECLEQAQFYIKPALESAFLKLDIQNYSIDLIKMAPQSVDKYGGLKKKYSASVSRIMLLKKPDVIITAIRDDIEIPIFIMEFSTAVFTKDHELQRTYGFKISELTGAIYVKVSSVDKVTEGHGGDSNYDYVQTYSMFYNLTSELSFHINWEVNSDDKSVLIKHPEYKSIPSTNTKLIHLFYLSLSSFISNLSNENWKHRFNDLIREDHIFSEWLNRIEKFNDFENIQKLQTPRTNWTDCHPVISGNTFTLKFNRFGHAMDPEREMLSYYSAFYRKDDTTFVSKIVMDPAREQWYTGTSKENKIRKLLSSRGIKSKHDLINLLFLGANLPDYESYFDPNEELDLVHDITQYAKENIQSFNAPIRNIILNSSYLHLTDGRENEIYLHWKVVDPVDFDLSEAPLITEVCQCENYLTEDQIGYIAANDFFEQNAIRVFSVSYPGAQSDTPLLPNKHSGRTQDRTYIDIIAIKDKYLIFQENKGKYKQREVQNDISKLSRFRTNANYIESINDFKNKYKLSTDELILGIGFGVNSESKFFESMSKIDCEEIDYFFTVLNEKKQWKVFSSVDPEKNVFTKLQGHIDLINTFEVR